MPISFVNFNTANTINSGGDVLGILPAGTTHGDLLLAYILNRDGLNATNFANTNFTRLAFANGTSNVAVSILGKRVGATESNPVFTTSGTALTNDPTTLLLATYRGVDLANTLPTVLGSNTSNTVFSRNMNVPGLDAPPLDGCLITFVSGADNDYSATPTSNAEQGYTILAANTTTGSDQSIVIGYQIQTTAEAVPGGNTDTQSAINTFTAQNAITLAIKPAFPYSHGSVLSA